MKAMMTKCYSKIPEKFCLKLLFDSAFFWEWNWPQYIAHQIKNARTIFWNPIYWNPAFSAWESLDIWKREGLIVITWFTIKKSKKRNIQTEYIFSIILWFTKIMTMRIGSLIFQIFNRRLIIHSNLKTLWFFYKNFCVVTFIATSRLFTQIQYLR